MRVAVIQCDNPGCAGTGHPEWVHETKLDKYTPPYGWLEVEATVVGRGPNIKVETCSAECVQPAVDWALQEAARKEREG